MSDYWLRLQELFNEACALDEESRRRVLDERCNGDARLRGDVERLVRAYGQERTANSEGRMANAGRQFGAWQTNQLLARGGMGEVWLARRADGQHEQQAALKILSPYLTTPDSVERFRRERQLLARLEHPNIARLLDGGMSPRGEPYLVMEYVDGVRLDRYSDERHLTIRERLRLMIKVCAAVNSAHQYLVVHRDLKPGNILVTPDGEPKLLDFGIAKMIDPETGREETATVNPFLTPVYASPEILRGEPATVPSDIYSLGVVMYELLTGRRPFGTAKSIPAEELERAFRDTAPARPSQVTVAAAAQRSTTPARLRQMLEGDLTTILEKTLRHDPGQRYQSAERLAEDLNFYLSNRPILARPQTLRYRAAKFISRNRLSVALAGLALLGAAIGVTSTIAEKRVAESRFQDVRRLAHYVLFDLYDDVSNLSGSTKVRAEMANRATDYLNTLSREAKDDRGLRLELADGYLRLGDIQGNMFRANLGDTRAALVTYQKGLDLLDSLKDDPGAVRLRTLIELHRAQATDSSSATKEAFDRLRAAVERFEKASGNSTVENEYQLGLAYSLLGALEQQHGGWLSMSKVAGGELDRAETYLRHAAASEPSNPAYAYSLAELLDRRAQQYAALEPQRAITYDQQAVDVLTHVREPNRNYTPFRILLARVHSDMLYACSQLNQFDAALEHSRVAEQIYLPLAAASPEDRDVRYRLAVLRRLAGTVNAYAKHWNESADYFAKGIADYDILLQTGPNPQYRAYQAELRMRMADSLWEADRKQQAETAATQGLAEFRELTRSPDAQFPLLRQASRYLLFTEVKDLRSPGEGLALAERARSLSSDPFQLYELLAAAYAENHRFREAVGAIRKAIDALPAVKPGEAPRESLRSELCDKSGLDWDQLTQAAGRHRTQQSAGITQHRIVLRGLDELFSQGSSKDHPRHAEWESKVRPLFGGYDKDDEINRVENRYYDAMLPSCGWGFCLNHSLQSPYTFAKMAEDEEFALSNGGEVPPAIAAAWDLARSVGLCWVFEGAVVLLERPAELRFNSEMFLHCDDGPAGAFRDGTMIWAWNGMVSNEAYILHPEDIRPDRLKELAPAFAARAKERRAAAGMGEPDGKATRKGPAGKAYTAILKAFGKRTGIFEKDVPLAIQGRLGVLRGRNHGSLPLLDRYLAGEHEAVWRDLLALGDAVREDPHAADALAVAYETMGRVDANVRTVSSRLTQLGFTKSEGSLHAPPKNNVDTQIRQLEKPRAPCPSRFARFTK